MKAYHASKALGKFRSIIAYLSSPVMLNNRSYAKLTKLLSAGRARLSAASSFALWGIFQRRTQDDASVVRTDDLHPSIMLRDGRMAGLVNLQRSNGRSNECPERAESGQTGGLKVR